MVQEFVQKLFYQVALNCKISECEEKRRLIRFQFVYWPSDYFSPLYYFFTIGIISYVHSLEETKE